MGLSVMAKGLTDEDFFGWSYGTFNEFRFELAKAYNEEFGELYKKWCYDFNEEMTATELNRMDELCDVDLDIFLNASDCVGGFDPHQCKKIYDAIKNLKINSSYQDMLDDWKTLFLYCYKNNVELTYA